MQPMELEADSYAHTPSPCKTETYLNVTVLTVATNGRFPCHLPTSSDIGRRILTCIMGDLTAVRAQHEPWAHIHEATQSRTNDLGSV
jgi:hypothetical protein